MKFKAINRNTKQSEYIIIAENLAQARLYMQDIDPGNKKYLVVEESKYKAVKEVQIEKQGLLQELDRQTSLCST